MSLYPEIDSTIDQIKNASIQFLEGNKYFSPDTLAWAVIALEVGKIDDGELLTKLRSRLASMQLQDGRVPLSQHYPFIYWPTPIALLAWVNDPDFMTNIQLAQEFLLKSSGLHWEKKSDGTVKHDTSLKGWTWIAGTHSWVQPTAMSILALKASGITEHSRISEASRMILDRQLPSGGWNYGNTIVFNKELKATPDGTGHALCALRGFIEKSEIKVSLAYIHEIIKRVRAPLSLAWSILAISAWSERPKNTYEIVAESLKLQERLGQFSISLLSQLMVSYFSKDGSLK
jgi:hypothetical protein